MRHLAYVLALLGGCAVEMGDAQEHQFSIVHGTADDSKSVVAVVVLSPQNLCTGTVIAPRVVLTAQHCTMIPGSLRPAGPGNMGVILGSDLRKPADGMHRVAAIYRMPSVGASIPPELGSQYGSILPFGGGDVALVVTEDDIPLPAVPVSFDDPSELVGEHFQPVGYGLTERGTVGVRLRGHASVARVEGPLIRTEAPSVCAGDSGGPLLLHDRIWAVASFGVSPSCNEAPAFYNGIASFEEDFRAVVGSTGACLETGDGACDDSGPACDDPADCDDPEDPDPDNPSEPGGCSARTAPGGWTAPLLGLLLFVWARRGRRQWTVAIVGALPWACTSPDAASSPLDGGGSMEDPDSTSGPMEVPDIVPGALGGACDQNSSCEPGLRCLRQGEDVVRTGVAGLPGARTSVATQVLPGGYCTRDCDPAMANDCGPGAVCVDIGAGPSCMATCALRPGDNGRCRPGQQCFPVSVDVGACYPADCAGPDADLFCATQLEDINGNDVVHTVDGDRFRYREGRAVCNRDVGRCESSRAPGGIGAGCDSAIDCGAEGLGVPEWSMTCLRDAYRESGRLYQPPEDAVPGGQCVAKYCAVPGIFGEEPWQDPDDSDALVCVTRWEWHGRLHRRCTVGQGGAFETPEGCDRDSHRCRWAGGSDETGFCISSVVNDIRNSNIGASCRNDAECYSPYGLGRCFRGPNESVPGMCVLSECNVPGIPDDVCGGHPCFPLAGNSLCVPTCETAAECRINGGPEKASCRLLVGEKRCALRCTDDVDCLAGEQCGLADGTPASAKSPGFCQ